ncbi:P-loop containing nucleoside triphosphate hydrolase protein [Mycena latifolia]|nr:P-loop containing nucleoside triphosphate hydrolase protein [Mycena latifolia]
MENTIFNSIAEMQKRAENMHQELLELITTLSDGTMSDRSSSIYRYANGSQNSSNSNSFSLLPSQPKIFHGRESELEDIVKMLNGESPRIAILGPGGMGKTSLARAALHHQDITAKYEDRFFVACDSVNSSIQIAALIATHLGLNPGKDLTKPVVQYFSSRLASLLILDNLETPWEPKVSRGGVEELLSLLADIQHLALIITMRGAERPAKVRWSRPFLQPLKPLTDNAAWETFVDIAEDTHESKDIKQLLQLTDNMPLAVDLIAHLVDSEGCSNVLSRWETERTTLLSEGHDRRSSLDASIALSISSSRMNSRFGAKDLLSLLSLLPDGLSDVELLQSHLSIQDILGCKAILIGTSLAYIDDNKRLKSLVPIREHVMQFHPPAGHLVNSLQTHFHSLLVLYQSYHGLDHTSMVNQITSNLGNLRHILRRGLHAASPNVSDAIECTIALNSICRFLGHSWLDLMEIVPNILPEPCNYRLEVQFIIETFNSRKHHPIPTPELLINRAMSHFHNFNDQVLEGKPPTTLSITFFANTDQL